MNGGRSVSFGRRTVRLTDFESQLILDMSSIALRACEFEQRTVRACKGGRNGHLCHAFIAFVAVGMNGGWFALIEVDGPPIPCFYVL